MSTLGEDSRPAFDVEAAIKTVFGDRAVLARQFHEALVEEGVLRGLIGPRETPRLWERHLLNSAIVADLIPEGATVIDVGSGAGFPGIPLAIARPDLHVTLLEPMLRRTVWLDEMRTKLMIDVSVVRGRAEQGAVRRAVGEFDVVTSRAVAPLDRLAGWCLPLARVGGSVLAMKGSTAEDEVSTHRDTVLKLGGAPPVVQTCGDAILADPVNVVRIAAEFRPSDQRRKRR